MSDQPLRKEQKTKQFVVYYKDIVSSTARYLKDEDVFDAIRENNKEFTIFRDNIRECVVVQCENKPRDMILFGIKWKEDQ